MYSSVYLKKRGHRVIKEKKEIFTEEDLYYPEQQTEIILGEHLLAEDEYSISEIDYQKLREFKVVISQTIEKKAFSDTMKIYYSLLYTEANPDIVDMIPTGHRILFDSFNRVVRLIGPKVKEGKTSWLEVDRKERKRLDKVQSANKVISDLLPNGTFKQKIRKIKIPEIAIGKSSHGELVCISKDTDAPRIGIAGMSGRGKSWLKHRLQDCCVEKNFATVIEINDRKMETGEYAETWDEDSKFVKQLSAINEITKPLPMIYLHPINSKLSDTHFIKNGGFKISIPFKELLKNMEIFTCFYDLGKSASYLETLMDKEPEFCKAKSIEELMSIIDANTQTKENKLAILPYSSANKIKNFIYTMWRTEILDITNKQFPRWTFKKEGEDFRMISYPWIVSLAAGLSVSIETSHIIKEKYYPILLNFFMNNIFYEKKNNPHLKDKTLMIFADEIPDLMKNKKAFEVMDEVIRTGRSDGIGFCLVTQHYDEIFPSIRTNLSHFFIFQQKTENKTMKKDFFQQYPKVYKETFNLHNLECVACGDFTLYNPLTGEKYSNKGVPIKMKLFPPNSKHKAPSGMKK